MTTPLTRSEASIALTVWALALAREMSDDRSSGISMTAVRAAARHMHAAGSHLGITPDDAEVIFSACAEGLTLAANLGITPDDAVAIALHALDPGLSGDCQ